MKIKRYSVKEYKNIFYNYHSIPVLTYSFRKILPNGFGKYSTRDLDPISLIQKIKNKYIFNKYFCSIKILKYSILIEKNITKNINNVLRKKQITTINRFLKKYNLEYLPDINYERKCGNIFKICIFWSIVPFGTSKWYNNKKFSKYLKNTYRYKRIINAKTKFRKRNSKL